MEHNPEEIWTSQLRTIREALSKAKLKASVIFAIGIANQRETMVLWDRRTGKPIYNAIVWECRRTADFCKGLREEGFDTKLREKTGLVTDAYFSATKLKWVLDHVPRASKDAEKGFLAFGTIDSWLVNKLTGGKVHATDYSNASRTLLFNIHELKWDDEILRRFDIHPALLPEVVPSSHPVGFTGPAILGATVPIAGIAGDQATTRLRCKAAGDSKFGSCPAGILRMENRQASIVIQNQLGLLVTINFMTDYVDATEGKVEARLVGDAWIVTRDNGEIYEVPLAAIEGD